MDKFPINLAEEIHDVVGEEGRCGGLVLLCREALQAGFFSVEQGEDQRLAGWNGCTPGDRAEGGRQEPDVTRLSFGDVKRRLPGINAGMDKACRVGQRQLHKPLPPCAGPDGVGLAAR